VTFDGSDNSCNLIGQYSVLLFILTFDWLMESIQIFLKLDSLFKAKLNVRAKTIQFILNLDSWQKSIKKICWQYWILMQLYNYQINSNGANKMQIEERCQTVLYSEQRNWNQRVLRRNKRTRKMAKGDFA